MLSFILGIATCNLHVALNLKFESVNECSHLIGWYLLVTGPTDEYKLVLGFGVDLIDGCREKFSRTSIQDSWRQNILNTELLNY